MKKILILTAMAVMVGCGVSQAQEYGTAAGLRISPYYGFTIKHFLNNTDAVEGILHTGWGAFKVTGLWERQTPAFGEPGLYFFYGGGAHIGGINGNRYYRNWDDDRDRGTFLFGVDGILGLEYTIQDSNVPINFGLDWKPSLNFAPYSFFRGEEFALSVRYTFN